MLEDDKNTRKRIDAEIQASKNKVAAPEPTEPDDVAALRSHKNFRMETTAKGTKYSCHSNNAIVLPTGCPTARIQSVIGQENLERMAAGLEPFYTYQQWNDAPKVEAAQQAADDIARGFVYINSDEKNISKAVASYVVAENYYLLRDNGTTYILNTNDRPNRVLRLMRDPEYQFGIDGSRSIQGDTKARPMLNLTDTEHVDILKAKPSYDNLMVIYVQAQNYDDLSINFATATKVW